MSRLVVYGRNTSSNVQTVMWAVAELGLDCERRDVGGVFGGNETDEYRAMNPNGLVPVLQDGDLTLFESAAIVRYLGAQYGDEKFWPTDRPVHAELDVWAEWAKGTFSRAVIYDVFWLLVRTKKADCDPLQFKANVENLKKLAQMADRRIGAGPYLAGDHLSWADILFAHALFRYYDLDFDRAETPFLDTYYHRLTNREHFASQVMVDYSSLRVE